MYDPKNELELLELEADIEAISQVTKGQHEHSEDAWSDALSIVTIMARRWRNHGAIAALEFRERLNSLMEEENLSRAAALQKLGEVKGQEFDLEGDPLVIVGIDSTANASVIRTPLLTNGKDVKVRFQQIEDRPTLYRVNIFGGRNTKGGHMFTMNHRAKLEITGMASGETLTVGIDGETCELIVEWTR